MSISEVDLCQDYFLPKISQPVIKYHLCNRLKVMIILNQSTMFTTSSLENIMKWSLRLDSTATTSSGSRAFKVALERAKDQLISQTDPHSTETAPFEASILAGGTQYLT